MAKEGKLVSSLLSNWKAKRKKPTVEKIIKQERSGKLPLSPGQRKLWFLQQLFPENPFYNYSELHTFKGNLKVDILKKSLNALYNKHEILRSSYTIENGEPVLKIKTDYKIEIVETDFSTLDFEKRKSSADTLINKERNSFFNFLKDELARFLLIKLDTDHYYFLINIHHIVVDEWSMEIFRNELAQNYKALINEQTIKHTPLETQYPDYASWKNSQKVNEIQLEFWKKKLNGELTNLNLPTDFKRPLTPSFKGASINSTLSKELSSKVIALSKKMQVTPFNLLLSVFYILLHKYTGQKDILIGTPISNREKTSLEKTIGFFNDTVVLKSTINNTSSFNDFVSQVSKNVLEAFENKDIAFDTLVQEINPERSLSINPFFQVMFLYNNAAKKPFFSEDLEFDYKVLGADASKFDITLFVTNENDILSTRLEYATDLFENKTIERIQDHFKLLLEYLVSNETVQLNSIPMQTKEEEILFFKKNIDSLTTFNEFKSIDKIISSYANKTPNATAVSYKEKSLSYLELKEKSNIIAQEIIQKCNGSKAIIGLCVDRSLTMITGLIGILKAGCAYLPIDPDYPTERINYIIEDSKASFILTTTHLKSALTSVDSNFILLDNIYRKDKKESLPEIKSDDNAYIIYTSGSTGKPKGVPISHGNIIRSTAGRIAYYPNNPSSFLLMSSISFDSSKAGIFWTLCTGGNLVISEKRLEQDIMSLENVILENKVSHILMLPSLYSIILENAELTNLKSLNTVIVAGEACSLDLCKLHFNALEKTNLFNEYGPTEATVWCLAHQIKKEDLNKTTIPIGKTVAGATAHILNDTMQFVPYGASGNLYIGGPNLSKGYFNRPKLTQSFFVSAPWDSDYTIYKTGDVARYDINGDIEFLGRSDNQLKIRGFRVELSEIEKVLMQLNSIDNAIVMAETNTIKRLVAYVKTNTNFSEQEAKIFLKNKLPDYMVPSNMVVVEEFPYLPNGKVDRKQLSKLKPKKTKSTISKTKQKATSESEKILTKVWQEVLNINPIGVNDNFFEIGGDSILSIQVIAKARKEGLELSPNQLFENQTIAELAFFIDHNREVASTNKTIEGNVPLSPIQHWFFETHKNAPHYWNQAMRIEEIPKEASSIINEISKEIITQHDALRLTFKKEKNDWVAIVKKPDELNFYLKTDLSREKDKEAAIQRYFLKTQEELSLSNGCLFKVLHFNMGEEKKDVCLFFAHHLIIDVVSWKIVTEQIKSLIKVKVKRDAINLPKRTTSIKKWVEHLKELNLKNELDYWLKQEKEISPLPFKNDGVLPLLSKDIKVVTTTLDNNTTNFLVSKANESYSTRTEELLFSALTETICEWSGNTSVHIYLERHGRETKGTKYDFSNTVGWFTSFFPIKIERETGDLGSKIIAVKEQIRKIPNGGIGYGVLKYLQNKISKNNTEPAIVFNYLGNLDNGATEETNELNSKPIFENVHHKLSERNYILEINLFITAAKLYIRLGYGEKFIETKEAENLLNQFKTNIELFVDHCTNQEERRYSPSDFSDVDLNQDDLDNLLSNL